MFTVDIDFKMKELRDVNDHISRRAPHPLVEAASQCPALSDILSNQKSGISRPQGDQGRLLGPRFFDGMML
jgi:hypothetical protein